MIELAYYDSRGRVADGPQGAEITLLHNVGHDFPFTMKFFEQGETITPLLLVDELQQRIPAAPAAVQPLLQALSDAAKQAKDILILADDDAEEE